MNAGAKRRKGQFFIVGAITIIIILHMLSNTLTQGVNVDSSSVQDNNPVWMLEETEKGLYQITKKNLTGRSDIDEFIEMQKVIAKENGYSLGFDLFNFSSYSEGIVFVNSYTMTLESNEFYVMKENQVLPYYFYCNDDFFCSSYDLLGYKESKMACCKAYNWCC
ncbi:MAG: hypothetical protein U9Q92_00510 [archaeon]|nr:hypothetical protein [archaeon]